jgi:hypothetical protein
LVGTVAPVLGQDAQRNKNLCLYPVEVGQHFVIPEAQDAITVRFKPARAPSVGIQTFRQPVLCTINLQYELCRVIAEVRDVRAYWCLLPKLEAAPIEIT